MCHQEKRAIVLRECVLESTIYRIMDVVSECGFCSTSKSTCKAPMIMVLWVENLQITESHGSCEWIILSCLLLLQCSSTKRSPTMLDVLVPWYWAPGLQSERSKVCCLQGTQFMALCLWKGVSGKRLVWCNLTGYENEHPFPASSLPYARRDGDRVQSG